MANYLLTHKFIYMLTFFQQLKNNTIMLNSLRRYDRLYYNASGNNFTVDISYYTHAMDTAVTVTLPDVAKSNGKAIQIINVDSIPAPLHYPVANIIKDMSLTTISSLPAYTCMQFVSNGKYWLVTGSITGSNPV